MGSNTVAVQSWMLVRMLCRFIPATVALFLIGCQGPGVGQPLQEVATGPWNVSTRSAPAYGYQFDFGPFHTSEVGVLQSMAGRRQEKPATETVKFINDKLQFAYELRHSGGAVAQVRTGVADTGEVHQIGFLKTPKKDTTAGSVSMNGKVVGEFSIRPAKTPFFGNPSTEPNSETQDGSISTSLGTIAIIHRFEDPPPTKSAAAFFKPSIQAVEDYVLGDRVVATRRVFGNSTVKFEQDLPMDVQLCIAAAMIVPIHRRAVDEAVATQSAMNTSTAGLIIK